MVRSALVVASISAPRVGCWLTPKKPAGVTHAGFGDKARVSSYAVSLCRDRGQRRARAVDIASLQQRQRRGSSLARAELGHLGRLLGRRGEMRIRDALIPEA